MKKLLAFGVLLVVAAAYAQGSGWQPYCDLVKKGDGVKSAGIFGQGGATWCASADLKMTPQEVKDLVAGIKDNSKLRANGVVAAGVKYLFLKDIGETSIIGRKGPTSFIVLTTKDGTNPANITSHEFVANDLIKKGF
jgi:profilin